MDAAASLASSGCVYACVSAAAQSYLHQSVSRPEVCMISSGAGVHRTHKLPTLRLVVAQVEAVAVLALHHVTQARSKLVWRLRLRLQLQLRSEKTAKSAIKTRENRS